MYQQPTGNLYAATYGRGIYATQILSGAAVLRGDINRDGSVNAFDALLTQQALVGLNVRQAKVAGESSGLAVTPRNLREGLNTSYTQAEAKKLMERNSIEENAVQMRLVERLIQQQEAVVSTPAAIRATLPEQGRLLTFTRSLQTDPKSELKIGITAREYRTIAPWAKVAVLLMTLVVLYVLILLTPKPSLRTS